jgi:hypothetical protein
MLPTNVDSYHRGMVMPETKVRFSFVMMTQAASNSGSSIIFLVDADNILVGIDNEQLIQILTR